MGGDGVGDAEEGVEIDMGPSRPLELGERGEGDARVGVDARAQQSGAEVSDGDAVGVVAVHDVRAEGGAQRGERAGGGVGGGGLLVADAADELGELLQVELVVVVGVKPGEDRARLGDGGSEGEEG